MEAHEIIAQVHAAFKNLARNLSRITGKVAELFRSHAREPKTQNPLSSGNASPGTHWQHYLRQNEAAEPGAGMMMNRRFYEEMEAEFAEKKRAETSQKDLHAGVLKESFDVLECLNKHDFDHLSLPELEAMEEEGAQLRDAASDYVSHVRAIRKIKSGRTG